MWGVVEVHLHAFLYSSLYKTHVDGISVVGIATRYGPVGPGLLSRWGRDFLHTSRLALEPTHPPIQWVPGLCPGVKAAGAWR